MCKNKLSAAIFKVSWKLTWQFLLADALTLTRLHRSFYKQKSLHRNLYTRQVLTQGTSIYKHIFYIENLANPYSDDILHRKVFTHSFSHTKDFFKKNAQKCFYIVTVLHTEHLCTQCTKEKKSHAPNSGVGPVLDFFKNVDSQKIISCEKVLLLHFSQFWIFDLISCKGCCRFSAQGCARPNTSRIFTFGSDTHHLRKG